jgi:hypothetical protein
MPDTFQALVVIGLGLLPGALYVWSFERLAGAWGIKLVDRILRFVGVSAVLHVILLPVTYRLWIDYVQSGRVGHGDVPLFVWPVLILYVRSQPGRSSVGEPAVGGIGPAGSPVPTRRRAPGTTCSEACRTDGSGSG